MFKIFGKYVTEKLSNQKVLYFSTSPNYRSASELPRKTGNL